MEYSPMMVLMIWALTPSDCLPTEGVHPEPYFTFNHGRPFLVERDPLTGAIDSNIKTTPVTSDDYLYEEYEESGESIDRKDGTSQIFTRNDITSPSKDSDLHKFLNLPVHYSSSGKFPLISSSYANTKVQGHGPLSNHKFFTPSTSTTTTVSPTYYTLKTKSTTERLSTTEATTQSTTTTTTTRATTPSTTTTRATTPSTTTTTTASPRTTTAPPTQRITTTTTSTTTTKPPRATIRSTTPTTTTTEKPLLSNYDYDYEYDYDKNDGDGAENSSHDYEFLGASSEVTSTNEQLSLSTLNSIKLSTTPKTIGYTTSTKQPITTESIPITTTNKVSNNKETSSYSSSTILASTVPSIINKENRTTIKYPTVHQQDTFDLKTSKPMPTVELKPSQLHPTRPFSSVVSTKKPQQTYAPSGFVRYPESPLVFGDKKPFTVYSPQNVSKSQLVITPTVSKLSADGTRQQDTKQNLSSTSTAQAVHLVQKKPLNEFSTEVNLPITTTAMPQRYNRTEAVPEKVNEIKKPLLQNNKVQQPLLQQLPQLHGKPVSSLQDSNVPQTQRPLGSIPDHTRLSVNLKPDMNRPQIGHLPLNKPLIHLPSEHNKPPNYQWLEYNRPPSTFGLRITERPLVPDRIPNVDHLRPPQISPIEPMKPNEGNLPVVNNQKPFIFAKPQSGKRPDFNTVQFGQPSKVENHFISVSPGSDNPSYSLQTSFSIGVPPPEQKQTPSGSSHGVGQVLFPDEEPEKRPAVPVWPPHQRPPQVNQGDPHSNIQVEKYPRPPWESHLKPPFVYHKKEQYPPIKRKPLPNILPQFRPNAKIGHAEPHVYLKPREPYDTLQPPPLPRPQFLRLEQDLEETKPLVHRRNGQSTTRVTTLQMMQGGPSFKRGTLKIDDTNEKNEPVFVVYPSNGNNAPAPAPAADGVVVGTRGPQRPLPPDNLDIDDDLDSFPLDSNKNYQARVDTPVLKSKSPTTKPPIKNNFPYTLIKPTPEERIITPESANTKEYTAFSPTIPSTEKDNDAEINIIPYLQDYMPFATKKPAPKEPWLFSADVVNKHNPAQVVNKHNPAQVVSKQPNIEVTPSSTHKNDNHREVNEGPQPQDFQAPFHASLTAPSQGWSIVKKKPNNEKNNEELTTNKELNEIQTTEEPKFDIQNFKPQLFGGFKPIVPPVDKENKEI